MVHADGFLNRSFCPSKIRIVIVISQNIKGKEDGTMDQKKVEKWMGMKRETKEHWKKADDYYDKQLFGEITEDYISRQGSKLSEKVMYLVASVGTSYEPIALNISLMKPEKVLFLYTKESSDVLDKVVEVCKLPPSKYDKKQVSDVDVLDIYQEIKHSYLEWGRPEKMYIDFTGGTKAMSIAVALAGSIINVQLVYVGSNNYLKSLRKPGPGSEELHLIANPLEVFGDLEIEKAYKLFDEYNYAGAAEILKELKRKIPDPSIRTRLENAYLLACAYEKWDALDFQPAYDSMKELADNLSRDSHTIHHMSDADVQKLKQQKEMLQKLTDIRQCILEKQNEKILDTNDLIHPLMATMLQNARVREKQEKYDMATLLYYRLLEMIGQRRLYGYGLYASRMDYGKLKANPDRTPNMATDSGEANQKELGKCLEMIRSEIFKKKGMNFLPDPASLLDIFLLLGALKDDLFENRENTVRQLKRIRKMVYLRNNSIFAHGLGPVGAAEYAEFSKFVENLFRDYCRIEKLDYKKLEQNIERVFPPKNQGR